MPKCWCGNQKLSKFSDEYGRCDSCETLVSRATDASKTAEGFYAGTYWDAQQQDEYGLPPLEVRARRDLPERCVYWLSTFMRFKQPGAKLLEIGSAHGGFVAMLRTAGYDAIGLELSPDVVHFARETFSVPMLEGAVEKQSLEHASFDAIILMDVIEHLPDPQRTLAHCAKLLKSDGILLVQTPRYPEAASIDELAQSGDRFLKHLWPQQHLNLFSETSARKLCAQIGLPAMRFLPPIFWFYDMFFVAARTESAVAQSDDRPVVAERSMESRLLQALLDGEDRFRDLLAKHRALLARDENPVVSSRKPAPALSVII